MSHTYIAERIAETERLSGLVSELIGNLASDANAAEASRLNLEICRLMNASAQNRATVFVALAMALRSAIPYGATERVWLGALVQLITELAEQKATHDGPVSVQ